jgi:hypothetical protein
LKEKNSLQNLREIYEKLCQMKNLDAATAKNQELTGDLMIKDIL